MQFAEVHAMCMSYSYIPTCTMKINIQEDVLSWTRLAPMSSLGSLSLFSLIRFHSPVTRNLLFLVDIRFMCA